LCRSGTGFGTKLPQIEWIVGDQPGSGGLGHGFVHQQDRDIVPNRINSVTLAAFQAFAIILLRQRLLAHWTNQDFEKVLGNHDNSILRLRRAAG